MSTPTLKASEPGATYRVVTSRRQRRCEDGGATYPNFCQREIPAGGQYIRAVMFPNHDIYSYVDRATGRPLNQPIITHLCFECASGYYLTGLLVIDAQRAARRAGATPAADHPTPTPSHATAEQAKEDQ